MEEQRFVEYVEGEMALLHIIPASDRNPYRESLSVQRFHEIQKHTQRRQWLIRKPYHQVYQMLQHQEYDHPKYSKLTTKRHTTLWEFYKAIRWDFKRKRHLKETEQ